MNEYNTSDAEINSIIEQCPEETVIAEFAGRDSIAAILSVLDTTDIRYILPVASFSPTEYGGMDPILQSYDYLLNVAGERFGNDKKIFPLIVYSRPDIWSPINSRVSMAIESFGTYTPCLGCHAYLHILRIPFAKKLSGKIITGERLNHGGKVKLNQTDKVLSSYVNICKQLGVELMQPLKHISDDREIERIVGNGWEKINSKVKCAYSGNYTDNAGQIRISDEQIDRYMTYVFETCVDIGRKLDAGN